MKKLLTTLSLAVTVLAASSQSLSFKAKTGDAELDVAVGDINKQGTADFSLFKKDLAVEFGVSEGKISDLSVKFKMQPGDIYLALEIAKQAKKPVDDVAKCYTTNKTKGWGVIAKEMGIKPGSKEFHALKNAGKSKNGKMKNKGNSGKKDKGGKKEATDTKVDPADSNPSDTKGNSGKGKGKK